MAAVGFILASVDRTSTTKPTSDHRPHPSSYQEHQPPKPFNPSVAANAGLNPPPPLRRTDSRSFQPAPSQPRLNNPINFQPAQQHWPRPPVGPITNPENRPPPPQLIPPDNRPILFNSNAENRQSPTHQGVVPSSDNRPTQPGQFSPTVEYRTPPQQYNPRPPQLAPAGIDPSRKVLFNPNPAANQNNLPRQPPPQPGVVRRPSPWSVLKEKLPADQVRPPIRPYQYQNYNPMNPQPPSQTPPPDAQKRIDPEGMQRSYLSQEPGKGVDLMRARSPLPPTGGRDSPTPQFASPTPPPGQPQPPRPMMQRTDTMPRTDPRMQPPFAPRPPRSPNRYDDDDVVVAGDPRMMMGRASPRPPAPQGPPFNKYPGSQDSPRNMSSPLGETQKYLTRSDSGENSKNTSPSPSPSPYPPAMARSPIPNKPDYQNSQPATPSPKPTFASPTPLTTQSPLARSPLLSNSSFDKYPQDTTQILFQDDKIKSPFNPSSHGTPDPSHTPEPPRSSLTPTPPTKPPESPFKPPETPNRNPSPIERSGTPSRMANPVPSSNTPERPSSLKRQPSGRDTPLLNGTNSELSSGRTSRAESVQDGIMNTRNLEKSDHGSPMRTRVLSGKKSKG